MQVFYAIPFVLLSLLAFEVCAAAPRWRRYRYQALVAPVAFGFCSIAGTVAIIVSADHLHLALFTQSWSGMRDVATLLLIYFVPGLLGSWCAVAAVAKIASLRRKSDGTLQQPNPANAGTPSRSGYSKRAHPPRPLLWFRKGGVDYYYR